MWMIDDFDSNIFHVLDRSNRGIAFTISVLVPVYTLFLLLWIHLLHFPALLLVEFSNTNPMLIQYNHTGASQAGPALPLGLFALFGSPLSLSPLFLLLGLELPPFGL